MLVLKLNIQRTVFFPCQHSTLRTDSANGGRRVDEGIVGLARILWRHQASIDHGRLARKVRWRVSTAREQAKQHVGEART